VDLRLTERQKEVATGLFALVVIGLGLGVGEGGLRVLNLIRLGNATGEVAAGKRDDQYYIDEETKLRRQNPGVYGKIEINSHGFRGPEIVVPKPPGTIRIAYLGASVVYDPYVQNDGMWTLLTTRMLDSQIAECRVDMINGGAPGFGTRHTESLFSHYIRPLQPDVAVVYTWNLTSNAHKLARKTLDLKTIGYRPGWFARHSLLWGKIEQNLYSYKLRRNVHNPEGKLQFDPEELTREFEGELTRMLEVFRKSGVKVFLLGVTGHLAKGQSKSEQETAMESTVLYMPYFSADGYLKAQDAYNASIRKIAAVTGATFIETENVVPHTAEYFADSVHFTARGSKRFSEYMNVKLGEGLSPEICRDGR